MFLGAAGFAEDVFFAGALVAVVFFGAGLIAVAGLATGVGVAAGVAVEVAGVMNSPKQCIRFI
jgi:ABC-type enterobactin transport system permease subunit